MTNYMDWQKFDGKNIPSSLELYPVIFDYLKSADKIIDFGCGYGKTCFQLYNEGFHRIIGVDINETGINYAVSKMQADGLGQIMKFRVENVSALSFGDNFFDFGIMQALLTAIPELKDRKMVLKEAARVLKPGATLYIAAFCQTWHSSYYRKRYLDAIKQGYDVGTFPAYNKSGSLDYIAHHHSERELVELLIESRFEIERFRYELFTTRSGNEVNGMVIVASNDKV